VNGDQLSVLFHAAGVHFHPHGLARPGVGEELQGVRCVQLTASLSEELPDDGKVFSVEKLRQAETEQLFGLVAVCAGCCGVAGEDASLEIKDEDDVVGVLKEFAVFLLGQSHGLFRPSALRDVRHDLDDAAEGPFLVAHGIAAQDPVLLVRGDIDDVVGLPRPKGLLRRADAAGPASTVQGPVAGLAVELAGFQAEGLMHGLVGPDHLQFGIEKQDEFRHGVENDRLLLLGLSQFLEQQGIFFLDLADFQIFSAGSV